MVLKLCDSRSTFQSVAVYVQYAVCCKQISVWIVVIRRDLEQ
jgi:hypothetical protein